MMGPKIDPALKLAIALHQSPGVYALLIGSGVSRGAMIPTGWEIVVDLTRRLVGGDADKDPVQQYEGQLISNWQSAI